jgi:hypothetical protein
VDAVDARTAPGEAAARGGAACSEPIICATQYSHCFSPTLRASSALSK